MELSEFFQHNRRIAVAFSGGVDSSYLVWAAKAAGCQVGAYFIKSVFQPAFELEDAQKLARENHIDLKIIEADILANPAVKSNPADRCYHCKVGLFTTLKSITQKDGYPILCDGTNASDNEGDRPGMKALQELAVCSPLRECGLTKSAIRQLSKEAGLFTWDKPSYACLATRIPNGSEIQPADLEKVEKAESFLFSLGFTDLRIRLTISGGAKIQIKENELGKILLKREEILKAFSGIFTEVLLDLSVRG